MGELVQHAWRAKYQKASFRGAQFHVETDSHASGRRVALHEFPKRNLPYAEDMGRRAVRHAVEGYLIGPDYIGPRDALMKALEDDGPGKLVHPLLGTMKVMAENYSVTETREKGGMCTFTMSFVEAGSAQAGSGDTQSGVGSAAGGAESSASGSLDAGNGPG